MHWPWIKDLLLCRGRALREFPQISSIAPVVSSPGDAPLSSPKQAAQLNLQHSGLPSSTCGESVVTTSLATSNEDVALPNQCGGSHQLQQVPDWIPQICEAIPFSVAVISSDGKDVLHHSSGAEPAAAQFLKQIFASSRAGSTHSLLAALLGDLEGHVLKTVHGQRSPWKGTISVEMAEEPPSHLSSCSAHPITCPVDAAPSANTACHARTGELATKVFTAQTSPPELLHDLMVGGTSPNAAARPAEHLSSALLAELSGTAKSGTNKEASSFGTNFLMTDPSWKLPLQSRDGSGFFNMAANVHGCSFTKTRARNGIQWSGELHGYSDSAEKGGRTAAGEGRSCSLPQKKSQLSQTISADPIPSSGRRSSLLMSENSIELHFMGCDKSRTQSLLRFLAQAQADDNSKDYSSKKELGGFGSEAESKSFRDKATSFASSNIAKPVRAESMGGIAVQSFDVTLSLLQPADGERSPFLVVVSDISDHSRVRATLSALAESQLELLSGIMPQHAIQFLALQSTAAVPQHVGQLARAHNGVTLMFMDIVGFTSMSKAVEPEEVMVFLNTLFSMFDQLTNIHNVHKVETAGDCYIVSGGIMSTQQATDGFQVAAEHDLDPTTSAKHVMEFAKAVLEVAEQVNMPDMHQPVRIRVGLHTGNVVSGLIGSKLPKFSVFGDAMNTASRMESTGVPGRIHASATTRDLLPHERWEPTGSVQAKGKGPMETFLWIPEPAAPPSLPLNLVSSPQSTGSLPCILLKQTQSLLKQINANTSTTV